MTRSIILTAMMFAALPAVSRAATPATSQRLALGASLSALYDSNLLEYSADQISLFDAGARPERFSIKSRDDLTWNPMLSLAWEMAGANGRRHALRLRGEGDFHQKNGTADFRAASVGWRETWSRDRRLAVGWYVLPEYYLRQLTDEDAILAFPGLSRYRRAFFSLDIASADWQQRIGKASLLGLGWQLERRRYNPEFRERDSDTHQGEAAWGWTGLPKRGDLTLRGLYRHSKAKAEDGDETPGSVPDDADLSYHGFGGGAHGDMEFGRKGPWRLIGDGDYQYSRRDYDSNRPADRYHFGRKDALNEFELGLAVRWKRRWGTRAFWRYEKNTATLGAAAPSTTDTGNYSKYQAGVRLDWNGSLWRSRASGAEANE